MTRLPTRRRLALRSLVLAAVLLLAANQAFGIGLLLPGQAVRQAEETTGTGRTDVVTWTREPDVGKTMRVYLSANDSAVLLTPVYLSVCGWMDGGGLALDCSDGAPFHAGGRKLTWQDTDSVYYAFGRVDRPDITRLRVSLMDASQNGEAGAAPAERFGRETEKTAWLEQDGAWYFLLRIPDSALPPAIPGRDPSFFVTITAYDRGGTPVAAVERVEDTASSVYGIRFP